MNSSTAFRQRGFTLTEALVAFAVTATGLIAVASFEAGLFSSSAHSKARTEALSLAQQKIEQFRDYTLASEDSFIDENGDGVMDADGAYSDDPINGQNAQFTRSWELTTNSRGKQIDVTVSWKDSANKTQSVMLGAEVNWTSPRSGVDQIASLADAMVPSPTGRAEIGDGNLSDYPSDEVARISGPGEDGLSTYSHDEDVLLVDSTGKILLTLLDACSSATGTCKDFVKISGTVYVDRTNTSQKAEDVRVVAADAAHCQRWVPTGTLANPPSTATGNYRYYNYTCYLGGGWHGNIGFVTTAGLKQRDKVCQGDPTSGNAWEQPVIALRRAYRGMIYTTDGEETRYRSHGIKDGAVLTGQDFVFTELAPDKTEGTYCVGSNAPMTRTDSASGTLFRDVPTDFVCLNADDNGDLAPDYLDGFDTEKYEADTYCPYDPTDPPVKNHEISGTISVVSIATLDMSGFSIVTSDGPNNCSWVSPFAAVTGGYAATYLCEVYDWGSGWTGSIEVRPGSSGANCPTSSASFSNLKSNRTVNFACENLLGQ